METIVKNSNETEKALFIAFSSVFCIIGILSFIFHVSPERILEVLSEFEKHHFFIISFFSVLLSVFMLKLYFGASESRTVNFIKKVIADVKTHRDTLLTEQHHRKEQSTFSNPIRVDKAIIAECKFDLKEVLNDSDLISKRNAAIEQALKLGNLYKQKVGIYFKDADGFKQTYTTIWQADNENICLKGGVIIPVKSIYGIKFI